MSLFGRKADILLKSWQCQFLAMMGIALCSLTLAGCQSVHKSEVPQPKQPVVKAEKPEISVENLDYCPDDIKNANSVSQPVTGVIHGQPFKLDKAVLENGILKLRKGEDFFADRSLTVFLFTEKGKIPENKLYEVFHDVSDFDNPHIHTSWRVEGKNFPENDSVMNDYDMALKFGKANKKRIKGVLAVCMPDEKQTHIAGVFEAEIKGFLLKPDGTPDLTQDSFDNFKYLAEKHLEKSHPNKKVDVLDTTNSSFTSSNNDDPNFQQTGSSVIGYKVGEGAKEIKTFHFVKNEEWEVSKVTEASASDTAFP